MPVVGSQPAGDVLVKVYCPHALADGNQRIWIREKMLEFSSTVLSTLSPYLIPEQPVKGKASPYSITKRSVLEQIPVLGSQPAGDVSHKSGCRLLLLSVRPAVTPATLKRAATNFAAW